MLKLKHKIYNVVFVFGLLLIATVSPVFSQKAEFKVLSYNTMHGFEDDPAIRSQYVKWASEIAPDVVLYQEMINFSQKELKDFAERYGHRYSVIMSKETGYNVTHPLSITSVHPIKNVEMVLDSMWHGYVHAKICGIDMFVTHLAPFTLKDRQKDITLILKQANSLSKKAKVLIAGDFNSFSRMDAASYSDALLKSMRKIEGRLEPKSGTPIVKNRIIYRNNLNDGELDYTVTDLIRNAGYIDAYYSVNKHFKNSVPVKAQLKKSSIPRRIDFIWVNPSLAKSLVKADIIQDKDTDVMSDHYPILITLKK